VYNSYIVATVKLPLLYICHSATLPFCHLSHLATLPPCHYATYACICHIYVTNLFRVMSMSMVSQFMLHISARPRSARPSCCTYEQAPAVAHFNMSQQQTQLSMQCFFPQYLWMAHSQFRPQTRALYSRAILNKGNQYFSAVLVKYPAPDSAHK
jgi:hypothetical protein